MAAREWQALTALTGGAPIEVERVRLTGQDIAIEGRFELPSLARLSAEDQVFVAAFVRCHGSIKQMEKFFGVSYPTIKNRLNRIGALVPFVEVQPAPEPEAEQPSQPDRPNRAAVGELLSRLEKGEMTAAQVLGELKQ
ncbi:MAG TPA: DUF2089 family protein [Vicinamibacterales bacterium]|jgi:hypothetical protein|nr:DUF2089 family protein [Vicinamibacterales bacterium]